MGCKSSEKPKPKHRKGLWSPEEDLRLRNYVLKNGHGGWSSVPINAGLQRNGKSCRLRWLNYLRPGLKRGVFSTQEDQIILTLHRLLGNKWSQIAQHFPGRTDNEIKNYWHSYLKKRQLKAEEASSNSGVTEIPSYESWSSSSVDTDQSVPQISDSLREVNRSSSLPKLMFAEWASDERFSSLVDHQLAMPCNKAMNDQNPSFQDNINLLQNYLFNDESDMFSPDLRFEGHDEFIDFSSGEDICSDFNKNNDMVYL